MPLILPIPSFLPLRRDGYGHWITVRVDRISGVATMTPAIYIHTKLDPPYPTFAATTEAAVVAMTASNDREEEQQW